MSTSPPASTVHRSLHRAYTALKVLSLIAGFPLALLALMALISTATTSLWVQALVALLVVVGVPLLIADRLLPSDVESARTNGQGLVTDVLSVSWMAIAVLVLVVAFGATERPLRAEAKQLDEAGFERAASLVRWLAGPAAGDEP